MTQDKSNRSSKRQRKQNQPWIPLLLLLGGVLLVGAAFLSFREKTFPKAGIEVRGAPSLKVDHEKIDLGDMKFNQPAEVSIRLTNVGDKTLHLTKTPYVEVVEGC